LEIGIPKIEIEIGIGIPKIGIEIPKIGIEIGNWNSKNWN
jgi:hypothetical protein